MKVPGIALLALVVAAHAQLPPTINRNPIVPGAPARPSANQPGFMSSDPIEQIYQGPFYPMGTDQRVYRTRLAGRLQADTSNEILDTQAMLVGFDCARMVTGRGKMISSLQPSYLINGVRQTGAQIGSRSERVESLAAREGYAVAKVTLWMDDRGASGFLNGFTGIQLTFARIGTGDILSPADQYTSAMVGADSGRSVVLDTMGFGACGINTAYTGYPGVLALLVRTSVVRENNPGLIPSARNSGVATPGNGQPWQPPQGNPRSSPFAPNQPNRLLPRPAADPTPVATLDPVIDARMSEVIARAQKSFAFVEGKAGAGSAFVCLYQGKRMLFTNQHVVRENPQLKFTLLDSSQVKLGVARAAVGHDLLGFEVADPIPALDLEMEFTGDVNIGDDVIVIGNTEGQGVIKPLPGKIAGLGPKLVEVTSAFLPGNSGSPILHVKSGRVIGIATYATIRTVDSLTGVKGAPTVRRFGYRIDSVEQWQPVNWPAYQAEAAATTKVHEFSNALLALLVDFQRQTFDPSHHSDPRLKQALSFLQPLMTRSSRSGNDIERAVQNFLGEVKNITQRDVDSLKPSLRYDFFQREIGEESAFRTELSTALSEALNRRR